MPVPQNGHLDAFHQLDGHEERLLRVESSLQDVISQVGQIAVKQDLGQKSVEQAHQYISEKIDQGFKALGDEQQKIVSRLEVQESDFEKQFARIGPLEEENKSANARAETLKKIMMSGILAAVGAIGVKVAEWLLK